MKRLVALLLLAGCAKPPSPPPIPPVVPAAPGIPIQEPDDDFTKMGKALPGDWLHSFPEEGQTFERYMDECRNRKSETRTTIYLQPLGQPDERYSKVIAIMQEYAEIFFGVKCVVRAPMELPANAWRAERGQYNANMILGWLEESLPEDALAVAGVTDRDLYSGDLNFVFGLGSLAGRRGVYSLCRFGNDWGMFLRRSLKLLSHEVGHIFGMEHCIWYQCVMSGANSLSEDDRYPMFLCPIDLRKLQWNAGFDRGGRYGKLGEFYRKHSLGIEADWVRRHLSARDVKK